MPNIALIVNNVLSDSGVDLSIKADLVNGLVPSSQLPSYVDDVLAYTNFAGFPFTGESGKIYVANDSNRIYRWSGSAYIEISPSPGSTDSVTEGSTNLYFTTARARNSISVSGSLSYNASTGVISYTQPTTVSTFTNDAGYITLAQSRGGISVSGSLSYNSTTGVISYSQPTNVSAFTNDSAYITTAGARAAISVSGSLSYNSSTGVISYTTPSTSGISEGTNLYYTDARARAALSFTAGSGAYNSSTGVITIPTNTNQLTNGAGYITSSALTGYATETYVGTQISNLVDAAPGTLNTLNELAAALGDDPNFATTIAASIGGKQAQLNGTGFVKASGTTITYDNSTYYLASNPSGYITGISFANVSAKPTTIAGYGITDSLVYTTSTYSNPSWITALAWSKITGAPAFITGYTETDTLQSVILRNGTTNTGFTITNANNTYSTPANTNVPVIYLYNTGTTSTANAVLSLRTSTATGGDPILSFDIGDVIGWSMGIDNSDSDKFKIARSWASLDSETRFSMALDGTANFTGSLTAANLSGTNTGDQTNISGNAATATNVAWTGVTGRPTALSSFTNDSGYITSSSGITGAAGRLSSRDIRTIAPNSENAAELRFGFTSWTNNNTAPWADYLHLRSYSDGSGGSDNLVMFLKSGIGMRIYQQTFGSGTAYSSYVDVLHSSNYSSYAVPLSGGTMSGGLIVSGIDSAIKVQHDGTSVAWRGRMGSFNASADKSSFLGNYTGRPGVFGHNNALSAWAELYVNTLGIYGQGDVYLSWFTYVKANGGDTNYAIWHAGNLTNLNQLTNGPGYITQTNALQPIYGDSGAHNLNVSGQQSNIRFSTGLWINGPTTGNYSHVLSFNLASDNRTVQMYLGDVPGYLWWRPNQGGTWHPWERIWTDNNLTNLNQLTNGPGYITSSALSSYLPLSGGTMSGDITMSGSGRGIYFTGGNNRIYFAGNRAIEGNGTNLQIGEGHSQTQIQSATTILDGILRLPNAALISVNNEPDVWGARFRTTASTTNLGAGLKNIIWTGGGTTEGFAITGSGTGGAAFEVRNDGVVWARSQMRAPIYYDSADTGYYLDPAGFSNLRVVGLEARTLFGTSVGGPSANFGGGRVYLRIHPVSSGSRIMSFKLSISSTWNWAAAFGCISADVSFYFDGTNINYPSVNITSATGMALGTLSIGSLVVENGFVSVSIFSANTNPIFASIDGFPSFDWNAVSWGSWESVSFPGAAVVNVPGSMTVGGSSVVTNNGGSWNINAASVGGRTVGNGKGNIAYWDASGNCYINNPEAYSGEVRIGAAWDRGGIYTSNTLSLSTGSTTIDMVYSNNTRFRYYYDTNGSRFMVNTTSTPYTLIDGEARPVMYVRGRYPALTLDHTVTSNTLHGPTIQFVFDGLSSRQWVIGTAGNGSQMDFGMSNAAYGNTNYNPHHGIGGYNGKTLMRMTETGVLIGDCGTYPTNNTPSFALQVNGAISCNDIVRTSNFRLAGIMVLSGSGAEIGNSTGARLSESYGALWNFSNSATWHHQIINGSSLVGFQSGGGNFGNGNIYASGDVVAYYSDKRLKHNLNKIDNAVEKISRLTGYTYQHNDLGQELLNENPHKVHAGLIAQEVQEVLPEVVTIAPFDLYGYDEYGNGISNSGENYLTIKYERIVPLLIEGMKEQQTQIESQKTEIEELKDLVKQLINK